jgi:hydrogenase maturation protease
MTARVLVAGVGNVFLADDGFGSEVARRMLQEEAAGALPDGVRVVDYGIRGVHLAYDLLEGYDALVVVDAVPAVDRTAAPGTVRVLEVTPEDLGEGEMDAHGMDPAAVLAGLGGLGGALPHTYVVGCVPAVLDEGMGLSPVVTASVEAAVAAVRSLVQMLASTDVGTARPPPAAGEES